MANDYLPSNDISDNLKDNIGNNYAGAVTTANTGALNSVNGAMDAADAAGALKSASDSKNLGKDAIGDAAKDGAKEAGKEAAKEIGKEVAQEGAEAAATGGTSLVKTAVKWAAKKTIGAISSIKNEQTTEQTYHIKAWIWIPIIIYGIIAFGSFYLKEVTGSVKNYSGNSYDEYVYEPLQGDIEKNFSEEELKKYYTYQESEVAPLKDAVDTYINGNGDGKGLKNALHDAITVECYDIIMNLDNKLSKVGLIEWFSRIVHGYMPEYSLKYFKSQPWPYDLIKEGQDTSIGSVLDGKYSPLYDDTNFLEMLTILCQNENYNWENCKYEDFNEFIRTKKAKNLYYELEVKYVILYNCVIVNSQERTDEVTGETYVTDDIEELGPYEDDVEYDTLDEMIAVLKTKPQKEFDGHLCDACGFFIKTRVKPFGLRELYIMAEVDPTDYHRDWKYHTYLELLDRSEKLTHVYLRKDADVAGVYYQDERTPKSTIYEDLMSQLGEATGRSAWFYIENPFNLQDWDGSYVIPPDIEAGMIDYENLPEGSNSLDNFLEYFYHNQCDIQNLNGLTGLCNYTSYMMIALYYNNMSMSDQTLANLALDNCRSDGFFTNQYGLMGNYGVSWGESTYTDMPNIIKNSIDDGRPLILHCRNYWVDPVSGKALHGKPGNSTGHFMVIYGYNSDGIKVADPGLRSNNDVTVSWESLYTQNDIYVRQTSFNG